jgi:hypothetical protein
MKNTILILSVLAVFAFKNKSTKSQETMVLEPVTKTEVVRARSQQDKMMQEYYAPQSSDDQVAANIRNFLVNDYLKKDLSFLSEEDRKFQYFSVDLNGDGKDEYFVNFMTSYFCGTGGCSVVLLDHESNVITNFSVMDNPIYAENVKTNGWKNILVRNRGELKVLKYENGKYPSNPSVLPKAPFDAPSGSAIIMFDENFAKPKTYNF